MASLVQKIASQAFQTFGKTVSSTRSFSENLRILRELVAQVKHTDVCLDPCLIQDNGVYSPENGSAPVTYMHIAQNEVFTLGIFILDNGTRIPLHDHPGMHGVIGILHGTAQIDTYSADYEYEVPEVVKESLPFPWLRDSLFAAKYHGVQQVSAGDSSTCLLTPQESNLHEIKAVNGPVAFMDVLAPPYDHQYGTRQCHYYRRLEVQDKESDAMHYLVQVPQPRDFWCDSTAYVGPQIDLSI